MKEISFQNDVLPLKNKLFRLALRITLNREEAEDVVQDTLIKVWNARDRWLELDSIEAYSLTIARNLSLDRIKKMEESGIIKGYTVRVDAKALGNDVTALMEISLEHPRFHDSFTEVIMDHPNILDCYYLTGDYDFVLKISCASSDELERIHRTIKSIPGVSATRTHFVLKEIKNMYSAIPEEEKKRF